MNDRELSLLLLAITAVVTPVCFFFFWCFKRMGFGAIGLLYALVGLVGLVAFTFGAHEFIRGWQSSHWPSTDGVIKSAGINTQRGNKAEPVYGADVSYEYRIDGSNYTGTRLCFGDYLSGDSGRARSIVARYQSETKVTVFYDPNKPERAVLETGIHSGAWLGMGIGVLFSAFAAFLFFQEKHESDIENTTTDPFASVH